MQTKFFKEDACYYRISLSHFIQGAVIHWDSKLLSHILKKENVERLAILISCGDQEQLADVPVLRNNPGFTLVRAVSSN